MIAAVPIISNKIPINVITIVIILLVLAGSVISFLIFKEDEKPIIPNNPTTKKEIIKSQDRIEDEKYEETTYVIKVSDKFSEVLNSLPSTANKNEVRTATDSLKENVSLEGTSVNIKVDFKITCKYDYNDITYNEDGTTKEEWYCSTAEDNNFKETLTINGKKVDISEGYISTIEKLDNHLLAIKINTNGGLGRSIVKFVNKDGSIVKTFNCVAYDFENRLFKYSDGKITYFCNNNNQVYKKTITYNNGVFGSTTKELTNKDVEGEENTKGC